MFKMLLTNIVTKRLKKKLRDNTITAEDVKDVLDELRISLIDADVNQDVVDAFLQRVEKRVVGTHLDANMAPQNFLINAVKDELTAILGERAKSFDLRGRTTKILFVGLQGAGKTTTVVKVAKYLQNKAGATPIVVAADTQRPAAIDQLLKLASDESIPAYSDPSSKPQDIVAQAVDQARKENRNLVLVDTAGRLEADEALMGELGEIKKVANPDEIFLVVDAMVGQNILNVAKKFHEKVRLTGIIITKFDSEARGGAALSLAYALKLPIVFIGTGEKIGSLDIFHPNRVAERILGMGDVLSLAEKAAEVVDEKRSRGQMERMLAGKLDLDDLLTQMQQISKMGSLSSIAKMVPGAEKITEADLAVAEAKMAIWQVLMSSMTLKERRNPKLFDKEPSRKLRVIKGSGRKPDDFNKMIAEWKKSKDRMEQMGKMIRSGKNPFGSFGRN